MPEDPGLLWSEIKKSMAFIRRNEKALFVPMDFPQDLLEKLIEMPGVVRVQRSEFCPPGKVLVTPAHPEDMIVPPV